MDQLAGRPCGEGSRASATTLSARAVRTRTGFPLESFRGRPRAGLASESCWLLDYEHLLAWAVRAGVLSSKAADAAAGRAALRPAEAEAALRQIRALRSDIYEVFEAVARDKNPPKVSLDSLRGIHGQAVARGSLVRGGDAFVWDWSSNEELDSVLWPVVASAVELLTSGDLRRVKRCGRCSWLFLDATKNRSGRWCSMEGCGTHEKSERFVARRRAKRQ